MKTTLALPYVFAAMVVILAANAGLTAELGAHPFWSVSIAWIGVPIGIAIALILKRFQIGWMMRAASLALATGAAYGVAHFGKTRFAASFAEDTFAGQLWYFGWIATAMFAAAFIAAAFSPTREQAS